MIRIVALTETGRHLGARLENQLAGCELWFKPKPFAEKVQQAFGRGDRLILICAIGIAVRTLAPVLDSKHNDPAVVVLDEAGEFAIPLLSGHEGGANDWAHEIAGMLGAQLILTTAKAYLKPIFCVGMGCARGCSEKDLKVLLDSCLQQLGLSIEQISSISSLDIKDNETGLIGLSGRLDIPFQTWDVEALRSVETLLSQRSDYVFKQVGIYGVAESAALFSAQQKTGAMAELILTKQKSAGATCAVARSYPLGSNPIGS